MSDNEKQIQQAITLLKAGEVIAIPTETVYGLAADASNPAAVAKIFKLKERPIDHPLIVHISDASQLKEWATDIPDAAYQLAEIFWPGPLTFVLKKASHVNTIITGGQETIALRAPSHPITHELLKQFHGGIAAPSANKFGHISPTTAAHVLEEFGDKLPLILDGGRCNVGVESTILDLTHTIPQILRPGKITAKDIEKILKIPVQQQATNHAPRVSGTLAYHYAPHTRAICIKSENLIEYLQNNRKKIVVLTRQPLGKTEQQDVILMPNNETDFTHELYHQLRLADALKKKLIVIEDVPEEWHAAHDRLTRASSEKN